MRKVAALVGAAEKLAAPEAAERVVAVVAAERAAVVVVQAVVRLLCHIRSSGKTLHPGGSIRHILNNTYKFLQYF